MDDDDTDMIDSSSDKENLDKLTEGDMPLRSVTRSERAKASSNGQLKAAHSSTSLLTVFSPEPRIYLKISKAKVTRQKRNAQQRARRAKKAAEKPMPDTEQEGPPSKRAKKASIDIFD